MKKTFITLVIVAVSLIQTAQAAPTSRIERTLYPEANDFYELGTSTSYQGSAREWLNIFGKYFISSSLSGSGTRCLQTDNSGLVQKASATCGSGGGGSGGGTFATTTSTVTGQNINYPLENTDIVTIGGQATTTARFYFDPNTATILLNGLVTLPRINATSTVASSFLYASTTALSAASLCLTGDLPCRTTWPTGGGGSGTVSTSTNETAGGLSYWTTNSGTPAKLGQVGTTTLTGTAPIAFSQPVFVIGSSASVITCAVATAAIPGCLSAAGFSKFDSASSTFTSPLVYTAATNAVTCPTCNVSNATVSSVATNNGLTGGTITTTGTLGLDTTAIFNGALLQYNGSRLAATGTPALTVGYIIATTTSTSTLPNLEGTDICITGTTRCLKGALLSITGVDPITVGGLSLNQISCARCYPFTGSTNFAVTVQATTGIPWFQNGIHASTTSQFQWASTTSLSSENGINIGTLGNGSRSTFTTSNSGSETSALLLNNAGSAAGSAVGFSFQVNAATRGIIAGDLLNSVYASSRNSAGTTVRGWTLDTRQNFGIGTSTPNWSLQVASNTPYIALTDTNASVGQWHVLISNSDGVFNIGTSSDLLTATSSSFSIDGNQTFGTAIGTTTKFDARDLVTIGTTTSGLSATTTITNEAKCINQKAQDGSWFSYYWVNRAGVYSQIIEANLCR